MNETLEIEKSRVFGVTGLLEGLANLTQQFKLSTSSII